MAESQTMNAGAVYRRSTWDEILSPEDYVQRMYPGGHVRVAPPRLKMKHPGEWHADKSFSYDVSYHEHIAWDEDPELEVDGRGKLKFLDFQSVMWPERDKPMRIGGGFEQLHGLYSKIPLTPERAVILERERIIRFRKRSLMLFQQFLARKKRIIAHLEKRLAKVRNLLNATDRAIREVSSVNWPRWLQTFVPRKRETRLNAESKAEAQRRQTLDRLRTRQGSLSELLVKIQARIDAERQRVFSRTYYPKWYDIRNGTFSNLVDTCGSLPSVMLPVYHRKTSAKVGYITLEVDHSPYFYELEQVHPYYSMHGGMKMPLSVGVSSRSGRTGYDYGRILSPYREIIAKNPEALPEFDRKKFQIALNKLMPDQIPLAVDIPYLIAQWQKLLTNFTGPFASAKEYLKQAFSIRESSKWYKGPNPIGLGRAYYELMKAATKFVSGNDLMRKFGWNPTYKAIKGLTTLLDGSDPVWGQLEKLVEQAGSFQRRSSVFDANSVVDSHEYSVSQFGILSHFKNIWPDMSELDKFRLRSCLYLAERAGVKVSVDEVTRTEWRVCVIFANSFVSQTGEPLSGDRLWEGIYHDLLGLSLSPKLVFDLIPYSFTVDWLYRVSDVLKQFTMFKNVRIVPKVQSCLISRKIVHYMTVSGLGRTWYDSNSWNPEWGIPPDYVALWDKTPIRISGDPPHFRSTTYQRWLLDPLDVGNKFVFPALQRYGDISRFAFITGAELLAQRL